MKRGFNSFIIIGVIGNRLDHSLANISILFMLEEHSKTAIIIDDYSEIELVGKNTKYIEDEFSYFSILNISGISKGITIKNAKYSLDNADINMNYQYGINNEVIPGEIASVQIEKGYALLIKVF